MRKSWLFALAIALVIGIAGLAAHYFGFLGATDPSAAGSTLTSRQWLQSHGQIVLASQPNNPPFYFTDDGSIYHGYNQDLTDGLEWVLGADFRIVPMNRAQALDALAAGEIDGILGAEQEPQLNQSCSFTQPYLSNSQAIFVASHSQGIISPSDLARRTVAVVGGTPVSDIIQPTSQVIIVADPKEAFDKIVTGDVDAFVGDELAGLSLIQRNELQDKVQRVGESLRRRGYSIAVQKGNKELLNVLNQGLTALQTERLMDDYYRKWFGTPRAQASWPLSQAFTVAAGIVFLGMAVSGILSLRRMNTMRRTVTERDDDLREFEQRQRILIENANDAIFSIHPADTSILEANRKAELFTGHRREALLHMRLSDLFPEQTREHSVGRLQEVLLNGSGTFDDMVFIRRDGSRIDVDVSASVIEFDRRKVIQILARDVTERKAMELELRRRNRNLSALNAVSATLGRSMELDDILDAALDKVLDVVGADMGAIYLFDESTGNLVLRVYRGEPPVLAVQSCDFSDQNDPHAVAATNGNAAQLANVWWPTTSQSQFGSFVSTSLRAKDKLLGVMNVATQKKRWFTQEDVDLLTAVSNQISIAIENAMLFTDLRTAIGDLFIVKQFNENVLQSMTNGLITVDLTGRITSGNLAAARIIGHPREQMLGKPLPQVVVSTNRLQRILEETLQNGAPGLNRETTICHRNGHEIPVGLNTSLLRDNQGVVTGVLLVFNDLSEMKKMEEEKRKLDRLAALGEMAAVLAHELRNPLGSISAGIQHLTHKVSDPAVQRSMEYILEEVERLNHLIENVLMISRPPSLDLAPAPLTDVLDSVLTRYQGKAAEKRVRVQKHYAGGLPPTLIDVIRIDQAVSNLVANALDAMPNGGDLRITVRKVELPVQAVAVPVAQGHSDRQPLPAEPQTFVRLEIADTGIGIPAERLNQVFEPFVTTKSKGTGLGLAITKRIVTDHQGQISVRSKEGVGTVFTIDLPVAA